MGLCLGRPLLRSQEGLSGVVGLGLCLVAQDLLRIYTVSKIFAKYVVVLSLGLCSPGSPSGRRSLQGVASGCREGELWSSLEKHQMRAFCRPSTVR